MDISLKTLVGKLHPVCRNAASRAANICMGAGHHEIEVEHLLLALLEQQESDLCKILHNLELPTTQLENQLHEELQRFATGSTRTPVFSRHLPMLFEQAWLIASLDNAAGGDIRSGHLLQALLAEPTLAQVALRSAPLLARVPRERLKHDFARLVRGSAEGPVMQDDPADTGETGDPGLPRTPALDLYTTCLTRQAREGNLDPVIGRGPEIRQAIDILMRRRQNNPILVGEAGVGKTAVVEGLAQRIAQGEVPQVLMGVELHVLDLGLLQAGASVKGEFESRLKNVIAEVRASTHPIILFIDEAHTMVGAGGAAGQNDAANLLKPALARGELRTIAATTWSEYKKYFEKDAALARRFQAIQVAEPDTETACAMLRAMVPLMEAHFGVRVDESAVRESVVLSQRYISGRQLPDKGVGVLDTACARIALGQQAKPAALEALDAQIDALDARIASLRRNANTGHDAALESELAASLAHLSEERGALSERWLKEQSLVADLRALRNQCEKGEADAVRVRELEGLLHSVQGEAPLVRERVDGEVVAAVVADWTGIPVGRMLRDDMAAVCGLQDGLEARILGQSHAMQAVAQRVRIARARLEDPCKPQAVFLFAGPSGVGKTETALALADQLYGGERKLVTINMSEYQEAHSVAGLKGAPPGYVGYGEGGVLTEAVRRNPYSVLLLDEVEKAHPDVLELFFQVFDKGMLDDAEGRSVDFRHCVVIMTSNAGSAALMQACLNKPRSEYPTVQQMEELLRPQLARHFKPAFLGRCTVVPFYPVDDDTLARIIRLKLAQVVLRVAEHHHAQLVCDQALVDALLERCTEVDSGARNVDQILSRTLLLDIADAILARMAEGMPIKSIRAGATRAGKFRYTFT